MKGQFAVMLDRETHKKIKLISAETGESMGSIVKVAVEGIKVKDGIVSRETIGDRHGDA